MQGFQIVRLKYSVKQISLKGVLNFKSFTKGLYTNLELNFCSKAESFQSKKIVKTTLF